MPTLSTIVVHPETTERNNYRYEFTPKHHGAVASAAQWLPTLSFDEEFQVFSVADGNEFCDERGWLYGVRQVDGELLDLGTWSQQIAEFPLANAGQAWHGYPIWSVNGLAPDNRRGQNMRPDRRVFDKMEAAGILTRRQRRRLLKGDHA